jgi:beta-lactamase regulating signal transducer with metallopeptidase domain
MASWMLYLTGVGGVLGLACLLVERGLRHLGRPVRMAWVSAMGATVLLGLWGTWGQVSGGSAASAAERTILILWAVASLVLLTNLRISAWTLRRNQRFWRPGRVEGQGVLVSAVIGPGVVGVRRPRVVLPQWVLDSEASLRRFVVVHEAEHVRARDTRLLLAGLVLVGLVPWCLPLWWQLHRLREAIETDCDARVLAATGDPRGYAGVLVAIAGRRAHDALPIPALAPRTAELKRRIRFITARAGDRSILTGLCWLALAAVMLLGLGAVPVPAPRGPGIDAAPPASDSPRDAIIIFSVVADASE